MLIADDESGSARREKGATTPTPPASASSSSHQATSNRSHLLLPEDENTVSVVWWNRARVTFGVALTVNSYFLPSVAEFATTMLRHAASSYSTTVSTVIAGLGAAVGIAACVVTPLWLAWRALQELRGAEACEQGRGSSDADSGTPAKGSQSLLLQRAESILRDRVELVAVPVLEGTRSLHPCIALCYFEDLLVAVAIGVISGLRPFSSGECPSSALALSVVAFLHLVFIVITRPYLERLDMAFAGVGALLQFVQCGLGYALLTSRADPSWSASFNVVSYVQASVFFVQAVVVAIVFVWRWLRLNRASTSRHHDTFATDGSKDNSNNNDDKEMQRLRGRQNSAVQDDETSPASVLQPPLLGDVAPPAVAASAAHGAAPPVINPLMAKLL